MSKLRCHISMSADGFVAGPNQSEENPLGEGGERLHDWIVPLAAWREAHDKEGGEVNPSTRIVEESRENIGAGIMGRNMFGPIGGGAWGGQWKGWWGDERPVGNAPRHRDDGAGEGWDDRSRARRGRAAGERHERRGGVRDRGLALHGRRRPAVAQ